MALLTRRTPAAFNTDDAFTGLVRRMFNEPLSMAPYFAPGGWMPAVDVTETPDAVVLSAELPGLEQKAVKISLDNGVLTITGEKAQERREGEEGNVDYLSERFYGSFQRAFTLPRSVDPERICADFWNGVLTVTLPKLAQAKGRQIEIHGR